MNSVSFSFSAKRDVACQYCNKLFVDVSAVHRHEKTIHLKQYPYHCQKCGHGMEKKSYLHRHVCKNVRQLQKKTVTKTELGRSSGICLSSSQIQESQVTFSSNDVSKCEITNNHNTTSSSQTQDVQQANLLNEPTHDFPANVVIEYSEGIEGGCHQEQLHNIEDLYKVLGVQDSSKSVEIVENLHFVCKSEDGVTETEDGLMVVEMETVD